MLTVSNAMSLLVTCIENVFEWMRLIFVRFDAWGWVLGGLGVFTVYRFLLKPFLGGSVLFYSFHYLQVIQNHHRCWCTSSVKE